VNKNSIFTGISAWLLAAAISFGGVGCLLTGFSFENGNIVGLLLFCMIVSLLWSIAFQFRFGAMVGWLGIGTMVIGDWMSGGWLLMQLRLSFEVLIHQISYKYNIGYGWGVVQWSEILPNTSPDFALAAVALIVSFVVVGTVCCRKSTLLAVPVSVLPLAVCLVLIDTVPHSMYLIILLAALVLMMMTTPLRRRDERQSNRLIAWLLVPVMLMTCLLFRVIPQEGYQPHSYFPFFDGWLQQDDSGNAVYADTVELNRLGNKFNDTRTALTVTATKDGRLYLRGKCYDSYDGWQWTTSACSTGVDYGWGFPRGTMGMVRIETEEPLDFYLLPSPLQGAQNFDFENGALPNKEHKKVYSYRWMDESSGGFINMQVREQCRSLPIYTAVQVQKYLQERNWRSESSGNTEQLAQDVGKLVRQSARYSLSPEKTPAGENDFTLWFLTKAESGYCAHFATTATVLLRALGVPARYVTGYTADVQAGKAQQVPYSDAHAWVEYFVDGKGWIILDPTPGYGTVGASTAPTQSTQPTTEATEPTTEATEPTTAPTEQTTQPSTQDSQGTTTATGGEAAPQGAQVRGEGFLWILWCLLAIGAIGGQYRLRCLLLKRHLRRGESNTQALRHWRILNRRYRLLKENPSPHLKELAEKAKFSQHTLTEEELEEFRREMRLLSGKLKEKPWPVHTLLCLVFAIE